MSDPACGATVEIVNPSMGQVLKMDNDGIWRNADSGEKGVRDVVTFTGDSTSAGGTKILRMLDVDLVNNIQVCCSVNCYINAWSGGSLRVKIGSCVFGVESVSGKHQFNCQLVAGRQDDGVHFYVHAQWSDNGSIQYLEQSNFVLTDPVPLVIEITGSGIVCSSVLFTYDYSPTDAWSAP